MCLVANEYNMMGWYELALSYGTIQVDDAHSYYADEQLPRLQIRGNQHHGTG